MELVHGAALALADASASPTGTASRRPAKRDPLRARLRGWWIDPKLAAATEAARRRGDLEGTRGRRWRAYLLRRLLLVIPTLFGIIAINFVVVQFAPGGPVEQMIAELKGKRRRRPRGSPAPAAARPRRRARGGQAIAARAGSTRTWSRDIRKMFGFDKPPLERFKDMVLGTICASISAAASSATRRVVQLILAEDAGQHLDRAVVHAARLSRLDPARHRQGGARRQRFDVASSADRAGRLRRPGLPVRDPAGGAVRRRQLRAVVPAARA